MVVFIAPMLIVQQVNNKSPSPTAPGPALGEGVSTATGAVAGPPVGRRNQGIASTTIRFAPFGGRSTVTGDVDSGYHVGGDLAIVTSLPEDVEGFEEKKAGDVEDEVKDIRVSRTSSDAGKSAKGTLDCTESLPASAVEPRTGEADEEKRWACTDHRTAANVVKL